MVNSTIADIFEKTGNGPKIESERTVCELFKLTFCLQMTFFGSSKKMPRRVGVATRFPRQHEKKAKQKPPSNTRRSSDENSDETNVPDRNYEESKTWAYLFFGSQHRPHRRVEESDSLEYLDLLPPKALREEEHELCALMAHSRSAPNFLHPTGYC